MSTLKDLLAQKAALERQIEETTRSERSDAISQIRSLMSQYGVSIADLGNRAPSKVTRKAGAKVAPKYRDEATGNTWSGRGLRPNWLKAAIASGKKLEDFAI